MAYNDVIVRGTSPVYSSTAGAHPLIPEEVQREIIKGATEKSAALTMFKTRRMTRREQRQPVLASKPVANWVNGDVGLKQTTTMTWSNVFFTAEEIACIVPIPINVLEDADYDLWKEFQPEIEEAIGVALDLAVFFGVGKPSSWPAAIATAAIAAGNTVTQGTQTPNDIASEVNAVMSAIEADGFDVSGFWMKNSLKGSFRNLRDTTNGFIFNPNNPGMENTVYRGTLFNEPATTSKSGVFEGQSGANQVVLIAGDWTQGIIGIRDDISMQMFTEGVIQDAAGNIVFNLMQQDMVALRVVARFAYAVPNPLNRMNTSSSTRYPFAVLRAAA